jgi:hypothetical protein
MGALQLLKQRLHHALFLSRFFPGLSLGPYHDHLSSSQMYQLIV